MSIVYEIAKERQERRLHLLKPKAPGVPVIRQLLMSSSLKREIIDGPWTDEAEEIRLSSILRADLEMFVEGGLLRVSLGGRGHIVEDLKRLENADEVWELKSDDQRGIRVFGRFGQKNVFIATNWQWRDTLGRSNSKEWKQLFSTGSPHTGGIIDDYLTNADDVTIYY